MTREPPVGQVFTITLRHTTLGSSPLDEWSIRHRDLYLKIHNRHIHTPGGIRTRNSRKLAATDPRIRPRGPWDRQLPFLPDSEIVLPFRTTLDFVCMLAVFHSPPFFLLCREIVVRLDVQSRKHGIYTGCNRRKGPDFGRVFLMLNYTDITQKTYIQSWTVWEIMASEVWNFDSCYTLTDYQIRIETARNMWC